MEEAEEAKETEETKEFLASYLTPSTWNLTPAFAMAAQITVETQQKGDAWECRVTVSEGKSQTVHTVVVERTYRDKLVGTGGSVEQLVHKSFEFLLARELKESILRSFNLPLIGRYFPEYESAMRGTFGKKS